MDKRIQNTLAPLALLACAAFSQAAWAWGAGGHMMAAHIAQGRLNAHAKREVAKLLAVPLDPASVWRKSKDFVSASVWADDVKGLPQYAFSPAMHFIDYPFSPDGTPLPDLPQPANVVKALEDYTEVLKTGADPAKRAEALRFIIHFAGDIHQPLHCATRVTKNKPGGDRGGNDFPIVDRDAAGRKRTVKLHSYWDGGIEAFPKMGANFAPPPLSQIPPAARQATAANPASDPGWKAGGPFGYAAWARESAALARSAAYRGISENREPSQAYIAKSKKLAYHQVAWAGYRLAALLNAVWP